jgi:hypothetical protein
MDLEKLLKRPKVKTYMSLKSIGARMALMREVRDFMNAMERGVRRVPGNNRALVIIQNGKIHSACAVGAAVLGNLTGSELRQLRWEVREGDLCQSELGPYIDEWFQERYPNLMTTPMLNKGKLFTCPDTRFSCEQLNPTLYGLIVHLNDDHHWKRLRIARYVESLVDL